MRRVCLIAIFFVLHTPAPAAAWGAAGHSIVAELAERRLSREAIAGIETLLGGEISLASISSWADAVQMLRPETRGWHFVNIPFGEKAYSEPRDCSGGEDKLCVVSAIKRFSLALADGSKSRDEKVEALKFLVHFIADIHQPLHCADRNDAGGSRLTVRFFGQETNLHMLWDVGLIERQTFYWGEYVDRLEKEWIPANDVAELSAGTPEEWASRSHELAISVAYKNTAPDVNLTEAYFESARPVVDRQLATAGVRLARVLNEIWAQGVR